jgi:hypothetical protein
MSQHRKACSSLCAVVFKRDTSVSADVNPLVTGMIQGENPVKHLQEARTGCVLEVALPGMAGLTWWYTPSEALYPLESNSGQVP